MNTLYGDEHKGFVCKVKESKQPESLKQRPQWVVWKPTGDGQKVPRPGPIQPENPDQFVSALEPESHLTYTQAANWVRENPEYGLGFALTKSDPFVLVDLDDCRNPETGEIQADAKDLIDRSQTWADVSVSGAGIHLLGRGEWGQCWHKSDIGDGATVEIYDSDRFVAMSGNVLPDPPDRLTGIQDTLEWLTGEYGPDNTPQSVEPETSLNNTPDLDSRLKAMFNSKNGEKYRLLWEGNYSQAGFNDRSKAEQSLCTILAFFLNKDKSSIRKAMNRACQENPNGRKWVERTGVYRDKTVQTALETVTETYSPGQGRRPYDLLPEFSTPTLRKVQEAIWQKYPVSTSEIADEVGRSEQLINRVLDRLKDDGLVESKQDPDDGRKWLHYPAGLEQQ